VPAAGAAATVLIAVHDRYFIRQFAQRLWAVEGGTIRDYPDLDDWKRERNS